MTDEAPAAFVLDTNVFIQAHRRYYALDLCPGFWECLTYYCHEEHRLLSIDRVRDEITGDDNLHNWVKSAPKELFASTAEQPVIAVFGEMMNWVERKQQFRQEAKREFETVADGWLAAYAKVHGAVLVTHEAYAPNVQRKVPLPNVCRQFDVSTLDVFSMLHKLEVRFNWVHA